jgi:hypothetical protein
VIQVSFNLTGLPASLGKQKSSQDSELLRIEQILNFGQNY